MLTRAHEYILALTAVSACLLIAGEVDAVRETCVISNGKKSFLISFTIFAVNCEQIYIVNSLIDGLPICTLQLKALKLVKNNMYIYVCVHTTYSVFTAVKRQR